MTVVQGIILGVVQGLTEFLPVSSSGHLAVTQYILGFQQPPLLFDYLVHLATLVAVIVYFFPRFKTIKLSTSIRVLVATLPVVIVGFGLRPYLEEMFTNLWLVGFGFVWTATVLWATQYVKHDSQAKIEEVRLPSIFVIGLWQVLALVPGISRSGMTVSGGLFVGLKRQEAFYFSFLMSIPAVIGALVLETKYLVQPELLMTPAYLIGFGTALATGLVALKLLDLVVKSAKLHWFGVYCLILGILVLTYQFSSMGVS